jgi:hypothetical protein
MLGVAVFAGVSPATAQTWLVEASLGEVVHEALPESLTSMGGALGIRYVGPRWAYLRGGLPLGRAGTSWAALGAGSRLSAGHRLQLGIDLAAQAYGFTDATMQGLGSGGTVEAMPLAALTTGPATLQLRSGLVHHASGYPGESYTRSVHQTDARAHLRIAGLRLGAEGRQLRAAEGSYPFLGASLQASTPAGSVWARAGQWLTESIATPIWGVGGALRLAPGLSLTAAAQQETSDPVYWSVPRRSWSIGVSRTLGGSASPETTLRLAPATQSGQVVFRIPVSLAREAPALAGDFNAWTPTVMERAGGSWVLALTLGPGVYRYAFRSAGGEWFVPEGVPGRMDDGFGGVVATLVVP